MMKINNKVKLIRTYNECFITNDFDKILSLVTDDVEWEVIGDRHLKGKEKMKEFLYSMPTDMESSLKLDHILTHGYEATCNGKVSYVNSKGEKGEVHFCDVFTFKGLKDPRISKMTSYIIEVKH
ncbi:nuclear transport factor 2 family protein [Fulvivirga ligni]|uniref:nuclear transport factor 2 family protein n=1 Tax=Fulvivirga ligni TaxID=2904246 RepID=UPI001F24601A|nr:nuclear transport factor 2 family protein [Fulvivirga ligni]UII20756.1 nuclear transport factor 2 family protein [Fulvivirga ligni]